MSPRKKREAKAVQAEPVEDPAENPGDDAVEVEVLGPEELDAAAPDAAPVDDDNDAEEDEEEAEDDRAAVIPAPASTSLVAQDPLQRYLSEIRQHALLTAEEEHALAVRYTEDKDLEAAYRLVTANLRLVVMIARRYERTVRNLLDLIQEGNIGLMEAVKKFDPYRGVRFTSYAVHWVRAYVIRYMMNNFRLVKLGTTQAQRKLFFNLQKEKTKLEAEGFEVTPKLLAHRLDVKPSEVVEMEQRMGARDLSVDTPVSDDSETPMLDLLTDSGDDPAAEVAGAHFQAQVADAMRRFGETLEGKDQIIFEQRMLTENPRTLQEIGDDFGVSRERVRQLEARIRKRLREFLVEEIGDLQELVEDDSQR